MNQEYEMRMGLKKWGTFFLGQIAPASGNGQKRYILVASNNSWYSTIPL
jgi:hypothetical protein